MGLAGTAFGLMAPVLDVGRADGAMVNEVQEVEARARDLAHAAGGRVEGTAAEALAARLASKRCTIAFLGEFKRGKSTLRNALVGGESGIGSRQPSRGHRRPTRRRARQPAEPASRVLTAAARRKEVPHG